MFAKTQHKTKSENVLPHRQWRRAHYCEKLACWLADCLPVLLAARLITLTLRQVCSTLNVNLQILVRVMENNFFPKFSLSLLILVLLLLLSLLLLLCALYDAVFNIQPTNQQFSVFSFSSNFAAPRRATRSRCLSYVSDSVGLTTQLNQSVSQPFSESKLVSLTREGNNWISVFQYYFSVFSVASTTLTATLIETCVCRVRVRVCNEFVK